jgi:disulfide oxidoreductase YuzD
LIARQLWQNEGFYPVILQDDEIYQEAIKHFGEAEKLTKFSINR